jgi:hypothetical protein
MSAYRRLARGISAVALGAALVCGWAGPHRARAATPGYSEDEIEAAFVYRFAGFVSWPAGTPGPAQFTIAVLDDDAVASDLAQMLARGRVQGRPAQVRRITAISQLGDARILFIGESGESRLKRWLAQVANLPVLVVTSQPGGLDDGSTINFLVTDRVRFEISLAAARRAGINISAELLSVATRVEGGPIGSAMPCGVTLPRAQPRSSCSPRLAAE